MSWRAICLNQIPQDEQSGKHAQYPYVCPAGALTIGWGRNIDRTHGGKGISLATANQMLAEDLDECADDLAAIFSRWGDFSDRRKAALVNVRFQVGPGGFRKFRLMIAAIDRGDWDAAADQLLNSALHQQATARTVRRAGELRQG